MDRGNYSERFGWRNADPLTYSGSHVQRCLECGGDVGQYRYNQQLCSPECARARKTRLQAERRAAGRVKHSRSTMPQGKRKS